MHDIVVECSFRPQQAMGYNDGTCVPTYVLSIHSHNTHSLNISGLLLKLDDNLLVNVMNCTLQQCDTFLLYVTVMHCQCTCMCVQLDS